MKKLFAIVAFVCVAGMARAQWTLDAAHSNIGFALDHMVVSEVVGGFKKYTLDFTATKEDFSDAVINVTIDATSISTDNEGRDKHLKSPDFFDAAKYPTIELKNAKLSKVADKKYELKGDLTMHGVTKAVTFDVVNKGVLKLGPASKTGFKATTTVNRKDFGLTYGKVLDNGGLAIGDEVRVTVNIEMDKK